MLFENTDNNLSAFMVVHRFESRNYRIFEPQHYFGYKKSAFLRRGIAKDFLAPAFYFISESLKFYEYFTRNHLRAINSIRIQENEMNHCNLIANIHLKSTPSDSIIPLLLVSEMELLGIPFSYYIDKNENGDQVRIYFFDNELPCPFPNIADMISCRQKQLLEMVTAVRRELSYEN